MVVQPNNITIPVAVPIADSVEVNSGTYRVVDSELGESYRRLLGILFTGRTYYYITGFKLRGSDTVRFSASFHDAGDVFGGYGGSGSATNKYSLQMSADETDLGLHYNGGSYNSYLPEEAIDVRYDIVISPTGTSGMPANSIWSETTFTASYDMRIGSISGTAAGKLKGTIYGDFIVDGRFHGVPAERKSDGVIGYYDIISKTFYMPYGTAPASIGYDQSHCCFIVDASGKSHQN